MFTTLYLLCNHSMLKHAYVIFLFRSQSIVLNWWFFYVKAFFVVVKIVSCVIEWQSLLGIGGY
jgi:hypothetical protein